MELPCSDSLNTAGLAAVFDSTAESYKFFWFGAILERIIKGEETVRFSSLADDIGWAVALGRQAHIHAVIVDERLDVGQ